MIGRLIAVFAILLTGCATAIPTDYAGPDAGKVVLGIGAASGTSYSSYSLLFRKRTASGSGEKPTVGRFTYFQTNMFYKQAPDYQSANEAGVVLVQSLPPGDYEVHNFGVFFNGGTVQNTYSSKTEISIPFSVKPGEVIYLGNYQANKLTGTNLLGMSVPAGAVFVVTDRLKAELPIAEAKNKASFGAATDATPEAKRIGNPFFVSSREAGEGK